MTSKKREVSSDVFSSRFVVASISEKAFARAAYGALNRYESMNTD